MKSLIAMAALTVAAGVLAAQPAAAQLAKSSRGPIDVTADQLETHNADCVSVWSGSAEALQDTSRLRSDVMIAHLEVKKGKAGAATGAASGSACGDMISLEAKGNVYYVSTDGRRVHGDNGFYDATTKIMTITGDVTAVQGQNVMRGTKMVYNTDTGEGHVEGSSKGAGAKNRPRGVFYSKDDQSAGQTDQGQTDQGKTGKTKKAAK